MDVSEIDLLAKGIGEDRRHEFKRSISKKMRNDFDDIRAKKEGHLRR
jgi:hypothetical protein